MTTHTARVRAPSLFLDGRFVPGEGPELTVHNPSDGTVLTTVETASLAQVGQAIVSARRAFDSGAWSARPVAERAEVLRRMIDWFRQNKQRVEDLVVAEAGVVRGSAVRFGQVDAPLVHAEAFIDLFLKLPEVEDNPLPLHERFGASTLQSFRRYEPVGVVAGITAYNFPFVLNVWKAFSALIAGNAVILRPSPLTPLSAVLFGEAAEAVGLPPGVLSVVVEGGHEGGQMLGTHPAVDMISFTGSTAVGQQVMAQAAGTMKRLQLELGGKSAQIYLPDAAAVAATSGMRACVPHSGQVCVAGTRIFVPRESKAEILEAIAASLAKAVIGHADDPATTMGPLINAAAVERCERFVQAALDADGRLVCGGKRPAHLPHGHYFEPTILDVDDTSNPAAQEEIFGPVACVVGYRDIDHAVEMANDTVYGLSGHVFGKNVAEAVKVAARLRTGTVNVNGSALSGYASGGGWGMSGVGRERGVEGLRIYQEIKCVNVVS